ncbi:uncharacterized protein RB166_010993 [Leptodactylus fuscus]|uniref:uncharacterized protein LOC142209170 n=1 Tax=Leptodactylus fuscus TaxID=238119 RepID=UPI003F4E5BEC
MGSMSNSQGRIWASVSCCDTDNCTPAIPPGPAVNTTTNGVVCPSCISADSSGCSPTDIVTCIGNEDTCVLERVKITGSNSAAFSTRGCATKSLCNVGSQVIGVSDSAVEFSFACSPGNTLSCTQCMSKTSSSCTGSSITCASGFTCGSIYTQVIIGGVLTPVFIRTCLSPDYCGFMGSLSNSQRRIWASMTCCYTDNCTPTIPPVPAASSTPNGVVCSSCISDGYSGCTSSDTVTCTGDEDTCVLETAKITGPYRNTFFSARGCSTKSLCNLGSQVIPVLDTSLKLDFACTGGTQSVHKVVLTPTIVCLLLLKFFH